MDLFRCQTQAYLNYSAYIWDFAAGAVGVAEAGGVCCDLEGHPLTWSRIKMGGLFGSAEAVDRILELHRLG